jgi:hypothetical protein
MNHYQALGNWQFGKEIQRVLNAERKRSSLPTQWDG